MNKAIFSFLIFVCFKISVINLSCIENTNNCQKCNPLTNLCAKCMTENLIPDKIGGCEGICKIGNNYCLECEINQKICSLCEEDYFPDKTGGCSYTNNCLTSNKGKCLNCIDGYILYGEENGPKICKDLNSEDLKNCKQVNTINGFCEECNEGYNLNPGDSKCIDVENCYESSFGECTSCDVGYYLNKKKGICEKSIDTFYFCKQTIDEINCDLCHFGSYLAKDGQCVDTINCSKSNKGKCIECSDKNYLIGDYCSEEKNCKTADKDTGLCEACKEGYYLDKNDRRCKSNLEDNEFKFCEISENVCIKCNSGYFLGEDFKCSNTENCAEADNRQCIDCKKDYYLGKDYRCTNIEHCLYSGNNNYACDECEEKYYFDSYNLTCKKENENFTNCKIALHDGKKCSICRDNFYLNRTDYKCYNNADENNIYSKCESVDTEGLCEKCINNYYLNSGDKKCTIDWGCKYSENPNKCLECDKYYCLDLKKGSCVDNDYIEDESQRIYINCNKTNEEGTACAECISGYEVGEEGYCVDTTHCEKEENGVCIKCKEGEYYSEETLFCANRVYGCISTFIQFCVRCDNITDLYSCTECEEGFKINENGICV